MQQVKREENDAVGLLPQCRLKCVKVRSAMAILHDGFAINDRRFALEVGSGADDRGIAVAPIISISAEHTRLTALNQQLEAVAIMLDFVNPVLPLWRLIDGRSKLWLGEPEPGGYGGHAGF